MMLGPITTPSLSRHSRGVAAKQRLARFVRDESGSTMVEMTLVFVLMMVLTFGLVEGGLLFWEWNAAEKATQAGVRKAVVSTPVAPDLATFDCLNDAIDPGTSCKHASATTFGTVSCSGKTSSCTGGYTFSAANHQVIVDEMRRMFPMIQAANVVVRYTDLQLGFAGREGFVGSVTVSLQDMTFNFFAIGDLLGLGPIQMPEFRATLGSEDINSAAVS